MAKSLLIVFADSTLQNIKYLKSTTGYLFWYFQFTYYANTFRMYPEGKGDSYPQMIKHLVSEKRTN